jgi:hypothetical protein
MIKTAVREPTIIRLLMKRGTQARAAVSRTMLREDTRRTSRRLQMSASKVGEGILILPAASGALRQETRWLSAKQRLRDVTGAGILDTSPTSAGDP